MRNLACGNSKHSYVTYIYSALHICNSEFPPQMCNFSRIYSKNFISTKNLINSLQNVVLNSNELDKMNVFVAEYKVFTSAVIKLEALDTDNLFLRSNFLLFFRVFAFRFNEKLIMTTHLYLD
jgi:hypothetical protein